MANAFTLFGEIKVATQQFQKDLQGATNKLKDTEKDIKKAEKAGDEFGASMARLRGPLMAAGAALAVVAAGALQAANQLWELMKSTSEYGSAIYDASVKTGLSAKTISALSYAAGQAGSSMDKIVGSVAKFNVLLGEAEFGNEKAIATLEQFNITSRDNDEALKQAITTLASYKNVTEQAAAAKALFKDRTADILPVIQSFNGDLPELMAKLEKMGVIMSDESAAAADEFGDTLDNLNTQAAAVGRQFALELMPQVTSAMQSISDYMAENKGQAAAWGQYTIQVVDGVKAAWEPFMFVVTNGLYQMTGTLVSNQGQWVIWGTVINSVLNVATAGILSTIEAMQRLGAIFGNATNSGVGKWGGDMARPAMGGNLNFKAAGGGSGGRGGGGTDSAARQAAQEAKRWQERDASATLWIAEDIFKKAEDALQKFVKNSAAGLGSYWSLTGSQLSTVVQRVNAYRQEILDAIATINQLEDATRGGLTEKENEKLDRLQKQRLADANSTFTDTIGKFVTAAKQAKQDLADGVIDSMRDFSERARGGIDSLSDSVKAELDQIKVAWDELDAGMEPPAIEKWGFFWYTMKQGIKDFKESLPSLKQSLGENLLNTLYSIGDVFAQAVMQWDGTAKGFFKSLAQGFRQLISQLISELIRLMVMKAVLQLIGAIAGGAASNPATNGAGLGAGFSNPTLSGGGGFFGGAASGIGGVAANIAGGFAAPAMAMAGGGSVANSTFNNSVTVNLAGGGGTAQTAEQVARVVMLKLSQMQNRNK